MDEKTMPKAPGPVGVIGLGKMGSAMATNLVRAGFTVIGTDLVGAFRQTLTNGGGTAVSDAREVGQRCRHIILSLPSVTALQAVTADLAASCRQGTIIMETGTLPLVEKQEAHDLLAEHGVILLDTPLSGTGAQAKDRDLVVFASGDTEAIRQFVPIMEGIARAHYDLGA
ncbi:MAG TPA: NAD(P)-binding domain-containing protein, partial [Spirochaetia bacterium]|nr:NAD(P)-binding domain-containing protein [Spirochaetia bacterium]